MKYTEVIAIIAASLVSLFSLYAIYQYIVIINAASQAGTGGYSLDVIISLLVLISQIYLWIWLVARQIKSDKRK